MNEQQFLKTLVSYGAMVLFFIGVWLGHWVSGLSFDFAGTRRLSAPGGHLVGPGDILPTRS